MNDKRQKNQLPRVLAFTGEGRREAPRTPREGSEWLTGKCETESPARGRTTDGRGLGAGELPAGFTTREGQPGESGERRHESVGVAWLPEAALASPWGATVESEASNRQR